MDPQKLVDVQEALAREKLVGAVLFDVRVDVLKPLLFNDQETGQGGLSPVLEVLVSHGQALHQARHPILALEALIVLVHVD